MRQQEELTDLSTADPDNEKMQTEIAYLPRHGEAGRLAYPSFRRQGLPLGSGAIESGIRRVVNLRLKSNGMFWQQEHAESLLQVRAQVISDRWDERVNAMRSLARRDGSPDWAWTPRPMSIKSECASPSSE